MGNEESAQLGMHQGAGTGPNDYRQMQSNSSMMNHHSSMPNNFQRPPGQSTASSMLGQLSNSFPNSIRPMNQLMSQLNSGSIPGISSLGGGGGGGGTNRVSNMMSGGGGPQRTGPGQATGQQHYPPSSTSHTHPQPSAMTAASVDAVNPQVPEVDLSGLTEEEKMMIQSVMARAQEETASAGPAITPSIKSNSATPSKSTPLSSTTASSTSGSALQQMGAKGAPSQQQPMIGYPEQRRMVSGSGSTTAAVNAISNKATCYSCRREMDKMLATKCEDCPRVFCAQCGMSQFAPDGQATVWTCRDCGLLRQQLQQQSMQQQQLPPNFVPDPSASMMDNNMITGGGMSQQSFMQSQQQQPSNMQNPSLNQPQQSQHASNSLYQQQLPASQQQPQNFSSQQQPNQLNQFDQQQYSNQQQNFHNEQQDINNMMQQDPYSMQQGPGGQFTNQSDMYSNEPQQMMNSNNPQQQQMLAAMQDPRQASLDQSDPFAALSFPPPISNSSSSSMNQPSSMQQHPSKQLQQTQTGPMGQQQTVPNQMQQNQNRPGVEGHQQLQQQRTLGQQQLSLQQQQQQPNQVMPYGQQQSGMEPPLVMPQQQQPMNVPKIVPPSVVANNEPDEYGYLDFEIDEEYEREGEFDEEDEEEELMDEEELDDIEEDCAHLYDANKRGEQRMRKQSQQGDQQQQAQSKRVPQPGFHHPYYGYHTSNEVYTIPEEDEEYESDPADHGYPGGRRASAANQVKHVQQRRDSSFTQSAPSGALRVVPGPIQRILPNTSSVTSASSSAWSRSSFSAPSASGPSMNQQPPSTSGGSPLTRILTESTNKARNMRSNSEPFLQMIKPFRRGLFESSQSLPLQQLPPQQQQQPLTLQQQQNLLQQQQQQPNLYGQMAPDMMGNQRQPQPKAGPNELLYNQAMSDLDLMQQEQQLMMQNRQQQPYSNAPMSVMNPYSEQNRPQNVPQQMIPPQQQQPNVPGSNWNKQMQQPPTDQLNSRQNAQLQQQQLQLKQQQQQLQQQPNQMMPSGGGQYGYNKRLDQFRTEGSFDQNDPMLPYRGTNESANLYDDGTLIGPDGPIMMDGTYSMPRSMPLYNIKSNQLMSTSSSVPPQSMLMSSANMVNPPLTVSQAGRGGALPQISTIPASQSINSTLTTPSNRGVASNQQQQAKNLQQFSDNAWSHATELSPILDVSPSVEAREAQVHDRRRNMELEGKSMGASLGIPRAMSGTISGMIDDFNRAIETLSINHNPDDMESSILQKRATLRDGNIALSTSPSRAGAITRRASTGQVESSLDHPQIRFSSRSPAKHGIGNRSSSGATTTDTTTITTTSTAPTSNQKNADSSVHHVKAALTQVNSAIEQHLQKQQQILIQQQQQFLQIQLEQQRLQSQMNEQLSTVAKMEQQKLAEERKMTEDKLRTRDQMMVSGLRSIGHQSTPYSKETSVNTDIPQQDMERGRGQYDRLRDRSSVATVMKQDKQVSTTPPPSNHSTPTSHVNRSISQGGHQSSNSRMSATADSTGSDPRNRVASASSSSPPSIHGRRLPTTEGETLPTSVISQYHPMHTRPPSSITGVSHSAGSTPPLSARKQISNRLPPKPVGPSVIAYPYPPSILAKKDAPATGVPAWRQPVTLTNLGYLDLDTKNVTFENDKSKRRKLPTVPKEEEMASSLLSTRKLIKERLSGKGLTNRGNNLPLKSSSSLDSSFGIGPMGIPNRQRPQSPHSSNSDISQFLASAYGRNILEPLRCGSSLANSLAKATAKDKTPSTGTLLNKFDTPNLPTNSNFNEDLKKIMDELKSSQTSAIMNNTKTSTLKDINSRLSGIAASGPYSLSRALLDGYSKNNRGFNGLDTDQYGRTRNASETRLGSLERYTSGKDRNMPFKSYEYESLNPVRYSDNKYRLMRPLSSVSFYENDLRESLIPNYMNNADDDLFLRSSLLDRKDRSDLLNGTTSKYDRLNSIYSKYDLAGTTGLPLGATTSTTNTRLSRALFGRTTGGTRSWHPSPYVSDVSDDEIDPYDLSVEEKAEKVRAEIKRRRQRLTDSGKLMRHYSFDDYNILADYNADYDPLLGDHSGLGTDSYGLPSSETFRKSKYLANEYPLSEAREKYFSDDLDAYYNKNYSNSSYQDYASRRDADRRMYDAKLTSQGYMSKADYPSQPPPNEYNASSMPLLNDIHNMSSRTRQKLPPDELGPGINGTGYRSGYGDPYANDFGYMRGSPKKTQFAPNSTKYPKYPFPIKRILLTQDPKIRSMGGWDGLGLKVVGGREIPGTNMIGAYIQKIHPSLSMNEIREGMQVIEWNGIPLTGISHDEVSRIIATQIGDEIEVVIRTDINLLQDPYGMYPPGGGGPPPGPYDPNQYGPQPPYGYGGPESGPGMHPPPPSGYYSQHPAMGGGYNQGLPPPHGMPPPPMQPGQQPQVILQHNHPVMDHEGMMYDPMYGKMMPPPPPHHMPIVAHAGQHQHGSGQMPPPPMGPPMNSHQHVPPMDPYYSH